MQSVINLARPYLEKTNLDIKIHTKVALVILIIKVSFQSLLIYVLMFVCLINLFV